MHFNGFALFACVIVNHLHLAKYKRKIKEKAAWSLSKDWKLRSLGRWSHPFQVEKLHVHVKKERSSSASSFIISPILGYESLAIITQQRLQLHFMY